jgi:hypothetical protein
MFNIDEFLIRNKEAVEDYLESILRGYRNLVIDYRSGRTFNGNKLGFLNDLSEKFNSDYMLQLRHSLFKFDHQLLSRFQDGFYDIMASV